MSDHSAVSSPRSFSCPHCQRPFRVPSDAASGRVACPHCQQVVQLPSEQRPPPAPQPPPIETPTTPVIEPDAVPAPDGTADPVIQVTPLPDAVASSHDEPDSPLAAGRRSLDREAVERERFHRNLGLWLVSAVVLAVTVWVLLQLSG